MYDRFDAWMRAHPAAGGLLGAVTVLVAITAFGIVTNSPTDSAEMWVVAGAFLIGGLAAELIGRWRNGTGDTP
jgi:hypothetical protein